jgi:uncharacterized protein
MTRLLYGLLLAWLAVSASAGDVLPPAPKAFFNDNASVVPPAVASRLNEQLAQYERDSSNQLLVAIFPRMQTESSIEDYANRLYRSWGPGLKDKDNGAVLLVFIQDRKMRIEVGYGLESRLTDAECFRIIESLKPRFRSGDYATGLADAVAGMIAATQGEYTGTGRTLAEQKNKRDSGLLGTLLLILFVLILFYNFRKRLRQIRRGVVFGPGGASAFPDPSPVWWHSIGTSSGGSDWAGTDSSWSGGGGDSGGGGASGDW